MDSPIADIFNAVLVGNNSTIQAQIEEAMELGITAERILKEGMIPAMDEVGTRFEAGDFFVPEMLISARAMQAGLDRLRPELTDRSDLFSGRVVIGTVKGDLHDIGKNLVAVMLEGAGFEIIDLGFDVSPERFSAAAEENNANLVAMSALLTTSMTQMEATINDLERRGLREDVKIMIGGAPVTSEYADQIGADGFGQDASRAVTVARRLIGSE